MTNASSLLFFLLLFVCFFAFSASHTFYPDTFFFKYWNIFNLVCLKMCLFCPVIKQWLSCAMFELTYFLKTLKIFFHFLLLFLVWDICYLSHCHSFSDNLFFFQVATNPFSLYSLVLLYIEQIWSYLLYFLLSEISLCFHLGFLKCLVITLQNIFTSLPFPVFKTNRVSC